MTNFDTANALLDEMVYNGYCIGYDRNEFLNNYAEIMEDLYNGYHDWYVKHGGEWKLLNW